MTPPLLIDPAPEAAGSARPGTALAALAGSRLHPNYVLRIAGEPVRSLAAIDSGETDRVWRSMTARRGAIAAATPAICAVLEAAVPGLDQTAMRATLAVKRAIYRGKPVDERTLAVVRAVLDPAAASRLADLVAMLATVAGLDAELVQAHGRELAYGSAAIETLLEAGNMMSGLSYTNPDFVQKLVRHFDRDQARKPDNKSIRNVEDSLLQYGARSSTKTSPLSSFTVINVGDWRNRGDARSWHADFTPVVRRRVEFKAGLMRHLLAPIFNDFNVVSRAFPMTRNRSIARRDGRVRIYGVAPGQEATGRTWGTGLTVSNLDETAILQCLDHVLAGTRARFIGDIVDAVCELAPKVPSAALTAFMARLFAVGYLVAETGFVEQRDAVAWARSVSDNPAVDCGPALRAIVDRIDAALGVMRGDDSLARVAAVAAINREVHALADLTGADHDSPHFKPAFYENCYLPGGSDGLDQGFLARFEPELGMLHDLAFLLDPNQELHARMADFFVERFGRDGRCSDVVAFLEGFDAVYAPGILDAEIDTAHAATNSPATDAWLRAKLAFDRYVDPFLDGTADIQLDPTAIGSILALLPPSARARSTSYSYVVQIAATADQPQLVLNQVFGGRSSILSRFLEDIDADRLRAVQDYVAAGAIGGRSAEIGGVFGFNANRHPQLSAVELEIPPFPRAYEDTGALRLDDLTLRYDAAGHRLVFHDPDDAAIDVWYHGLLIPSLLPQLHRILALAFTEGPSLAITKALSMRSMAGGRAASFIPRIMLGNIVLFRRTSMIASTGVPDAAVPAPDFYRAVREWQATHNLPDRTFVRALPLPDAAGGEIDWGKVNFKDMKPFYVDLRSPRFVRLLQNMIKRNPAMAICVSELLPDFDGHPTTVAGLPHVAELHFELTRPASVPVATATWHTVRVAYFAEDRRALIDGPIADAIADARDLGVDRIFLQRHWKFGPHVDLNIHADAETFVVKLFPRIEAILSAWLTANSSTTVLDPAAYARLSRDIGVLELERGPYLPLLADNSVTVIPYATSASIVHPALAASREQWLSDSLDIVLALYRRKAHDPDGVFLALHAMLAAVADTWIDGMQQGYMSLRSHADYFFAAHDLGGGVRARFDAIDRKRGAEFDALTVALLDASPASLPLDDELSGLIDRTRQVVRATAARNREIVDANLADLVGQTVHMDLAMALQDEAPSPLRDSVVGRPNSDLGEQFLNSAAGQAMQATPEFIAFRTNVNFFYALLPLLEVAPVQKFLLCHLTATSVARVTERDRQPALVAAE